MVASEARPPKEEVNPHYFGTMRALYKLVFPPQASEYDHRSPSLHFRMIICFGSKALEHGSIFYLGNLNVLEMQNPDAETIVVVRRYVKLKYIWCKRSAGGWWSLDI